MKEVLVELAHQDFDFILVDRNYEKSLKRKQLIESINKEAKVTLFTADMCDIESVKNVTEQLLKADMDYLILGAAIYNVKLVKTSSGYNNVFTTNFVSQYYVASKLMDTKKNLICLPICSISYTFAHFKNEDLDYTKCNKINKVYGNSKKFLMLSLMEKYKNENRVRLSHPGVTNTSLTSHYPKWINWLIVFGVKTLFPSNKNAARSILKAIELETPYMYWIGPRFINVYGKPKLLKLKGIKKEEIQKIYNSAEGILKRLK